MNEPTNDPPPNTSADPPRNVGTSAAASGTAYSFGLRGMLLGVLVVALLLGNLFSLWRLRRAEAELGVLRQEVGYLGETPDERVAAVRLVSDEPLTWRARVKIPAQAKYRVAYSAIWPADAAKPQWFSALPVSPGESVVTTQIRLDPQDGRWKIITLVHDDSGTRRMATVLSESLADVFRESHDVIRAGIGQVPVDVAPDRPLRLLDEQWLVGEGSQLLYGDVPVRGDQPGVFVELQPDNTPL